MQAPSRHGTGLRRREVPHSRAPLHRHRRRGAVHAPSGRVSPSGRAAPSPHRVQRQVEPQHMYPRHAEAPLLRMHRNQRANLSLRAIAGSGDAASPGARLRRADMRVDAGAGAGMRWWRCTIRCRDATGTSLCTPRRSASTAPLWQRAPSERGARRCCHRRRLDAPSRQRQEQDDRDQDEVAGMQIGGGAGCRGRRRWRKAPRAGEFLARIRAALRGGGTGRVGGDLEVDVSRRMAQGSAQADPARVGAAGGEGHVNTQRKLPTTNWAPAHGPETQHTAGRRRQPR